jgi:hypothetical protein
MASWPGLSWPGLGPCHGWSLTWTDLPDSVVWNRPAWTVTDVEWERFLRFVVARRPPFIALVIKLKRPGDQNA